MGMAMILGFLAGNGVIPVEPPAPLQPVPSPEQLAWYEMEMGLFCHFGVNTFLDQEWGDGSEDPNVFQPSELDARQWASVARECGMKYLVLTAKHHDGFCLFPSAYTLHSVASSSWRNGKGDVVREVSEACHNSGLMFGIYLSPWDRHEPTYADPPRYDQFYMNQLRELLTRYGRVGEVWLDGAGSEGHTYDWEGYFALIRKLQPHALIAICGPDIRWVGNEDGLAPETVWYPYERDGKLVWYPPECDVPIRKQYWFYHTNTEKTVRTAQELLDIYYRSVGRGAGLLLNIAPDRRGMLPEEDVAALREMWRILSETFRVNLAEGKTIRASHVRGNASAYSPENLIDGNNDNYWTTDDTITQASIEVDFGSPVTFDHTVVQEYLPLGQRVASYAIDVWNGDGWYNVIKGTTIGHKRIDRFPKTTASKVRLTIDQAKACPVLRRFGVYCAP